MNKTKKKRTIHFFKKSYKKVHKRTQKKTHKRTQKKTYFGGKVEGSGGYGCLLIPSIKCKGVNTNHNTHNTHNTHTTHTNVKTITKLMLVKNAKKEYNEIMKYKKILSSIPDYNKYFLIDNVELCKPDKLSASDLQDYETKCKALNKKKITKSVVNSKLDSILAINMPNGGKDIDDFIKKCDNYNEYKKMNNSLIELLFNAIIPMNNKRIYHCDVKAGNVLIDSNYQCKIIDWGLSISYSNYNQNDSYPIARGHFNRPIQFNMPFSVIILNNEFKDSYEDFLTNQVKLDNTLQYADVRSFVLEHFVHLNKEYKTGHIRYINKIMRMLFNENIEPLHKKIKNDIVTTEYTYYYIIEYISKIVYKYTDIENKNFNMQDYFKDVFLKSIDLWGFVLCYLPIITVMSYTKKEKLTNTDIKIYGKIKYMIVQYLYENPLEPINPMNIKKELEELNVLFDEAERETPNSLNSILDRYKRKINDEKNDSSDTIDDENKSNTETAKLIQFFSSSYSNK
jgi:hypothetical protein